MILQMEGTVDRKRQLLSRCPGVPLKMKRQENIEENEKPVEKPTSPAAVRVVATGILVIVPFWFTGMAAVRGVSVSAIDLFVIFGFIIIVRLLSCIIEGVAVFCRRRGGRVILGRWPRARMHE